jgi:hypothetical protein
MTPVAFGLIVFASVLGGGLLGTFLRGVLPERHLGAESRDLVRLTMGLPATMSARRRRQAAESFAPGVGSITRRTQYPVTAAISEPTRMPTLA